MNAPAEDTPALERLLEHIRGELQRECAQIEVQAQQKARAILRDARRDARERVSRALAARRADQQARYVHERAGVEARLRRRRQQIAGRVIDDCWPLLVAELKARWDVPEARRQWAAAALRLAGDKLMAEDWCVRCPPDWPQAERDDAVGSAQVRVLGLHWQADAGVAAGLSIEAGGACVDATPAGLLARREEVEGLLLATIDAVRRGPGP